MKRKFDIEVDCANCAARVEEAIRKIDGVEEVSVNFLTQKISITADDARFAEILEEAKRRGKKVDADCVIHTE